MPPLRLVRRERFAQLLFAHPETPDYEHYITAGYSAKTAMTAATQLRNNSEIIGRIAELQQEAASPLILSVRERKEILSEIAQGKLSDYQTQGIDGTWTSYGPESPNSRSVRKVTSRTEYDKDGNTVQVTTSLELDDRRGAIAELNKMEGAYPPTKLGIDDETKETVGRHLQRLLELRSDDYQD